jgi:hypothetical protein
LALQVRARWPLVYDCTSLYKRRQADFLSASLRAFRVHRSPPLRGPNINSSALLARRSNINDHGYGYGLPLSSLLQHQVAANIGACIHQGSVAAMKLGTIAILMLLITNLVGAESDEKKCEMPARPIVVSAEVVAVATRETIHDSFQGGVPDAIDSNVEVRVTEPCAMKDLKLDMWRPQPAPEGLPTPSVGDQIEFTWGKNVDLENLYWSMARPVSIKHDSLPED